MNLKRSRLFLAIGMMLLVVLFACTEAPSFEATIHFDSNGGTMIESVIYDNEATITIPENPTKDGYIFSGWYFDNETFERPFTANSLLDESIQSDFTVYAKWNITSYTLQFVNEDDTVLSTTDIEFGTDLSTVIPPLATKLGYTFTGWDIELPLTMPANNVTLKAQFNISQFSITFESNEGSSIDVITQDYNTDVLAPVDPIKEGYTFGGWYADEALTTVFGFITIPAEDITIYAKWTIAEYTIYYKAVTDDYDINLSIPLNLGEKIINLSLGYMHSSALTSEGRVYTWGYDLLGGGSTTNNLLPMDITGVFNLGDGETIVNLEVGNSHSVVLTSEGRVFTWGWNSYGQLGDGSIIDKPIPVDITSNFNLALGETIISFSLGGEHSSALTSKGRIFTWGFNEYGQLGDGTSTYRTIPTDITNHFNLSTEETLTMLSLGRDHSAAVTSKGRIFTWGHNWGGQLGDGSTVFKSTPTEITDNFNLGVEETFINLSLGGSHSAVFTSEGRVFTWGYNNFGQLGDGANTDKTMPTEITNNFNLSIGEKVVSLALGGEHSSAMTSKGRVFIWGNNWERALGDGTRTNKSIPTVMNSHFTLSSGETIVSLSLASYGHSSALTSKGRVYTWGYNELGQLGDGTTISKSLPILVLFNTPLLEYKDTYDFNQVIIEYLPVLEGYTFGGWYTTPELTTLYTFDKMPSTDFTLYAKMEVNQYTISFDSNEGSLVDPITEDFQTSISAPQDPTRQGYTFDGWHLDEAFLIAFDFTTMSAEDITLYAKWSPNLYNVTFVLNNGEVDSLETDYAGTDLMVPTYNGYTFNGWYLDIELTDAYAFDTFPVENMILYAKWEINSYTISFNSNGGTQVDSITQEYLSIVDEPTSPTLTGYTFEGWYTNTALTDKYIFSTMPAQDLNLYGAWLVNITMVQVGDVGTIYTIPTGATDAETATAEGGYLMATTETTYELWYQVRIWALANGYFFQNSGREGHDGIEGAVPTVDMLEPVTTISWRDVVVWTNALSEMKGLDPVYRTADGDIIKDSRDASASVVDAAVQTANNGYRLPTSIEWTMAAGWKNDTTSTNGSILVGGRYWTPGSYASGATANTDDEDATRAVAWYSGASVIEVTRPVGQLLPNHLGIYDMSGNIGEWTYTLNGSLRAIRGDSYLTIAEYIHLGYISSTSSDGAYNNLGFRVVRNP